MGAGPPAPNGLGKTLRTNSGPCNVVLRSFRMFSLGQRVQPATMIGFKQIEFFDHTGPGPPRYEGKWSSKEDRRPHSHPDPGAAHRHVRAWPQSSGSHHSVNSQDNEASTALF